ncbi:hypothetical protein GCM10022383_06680 [Microbacterium soli]|uniref:Uncharacterized protein n=1 Tax=Microbacterium soli TaxID=446075 RepID=A0ABP7MXD2_9MICO
MMFLTRAVNEKDAPYVVLPYARGYVRNSQSPTRCYQRLRATRSSSNPPSRRRAIIPSPVPTLYEVDRAVERASMPQCNWLGVWGHARPRVGHKPSRAVVG